MKFQELTNDKLSLALSRQGITEPTPVQAAAIPKISEGKDVIVMSETGSGKTLAYLLPIFRFIRENIGLRSVQAVILAPTHELAAQIHKQACLLSGTSEDEQKIASALLIGGANLSRQLDTLKEKPQVVIGSAGRVLELIKMKKLSVHHVKTIVIDEADRMLSDKNIESVQAVIKCTLRDRQLVMVSATMPSEIITIASSVMKSPEIIGVSGGGTSKLPEQIIHSFIQVPLRDKFSLLRKIIAAEHIKRGIIFMNNTHEMTLAASKLEYHNIRCAVLGGDMRKEDRRNAIEAIRNNDVIMIATDLAARGLDIPGVTHIINFEIAEDPEIYLHRAGRTGRMNQPGNVISIAQSGDITYLKRVSKKLGIAIPEYIVIDGKYLQKA